MTSKNQTITQLRHKDYLKNAWLYKMESHDEFSDRVAHRLIPDYRGTKDSRTYDIIAVCAYPPKFFFDRIFRSIELRTKMKSPIQSVKKAQRHKEKLEQYAYLADCLDIWQDDSELQSNPVVKEAMKAFMEAAEKVFPHFVSMQDVEENRMIRLCTYGGVLGSKRSKNVFNEGMCKVETYREKDYFRCIRHGFTKHADYAFFKWLNGNSRCYILPPWLWSQWGINQPYARDFAVFGEKALVEYYSNHKVMVHVEPLDNSWPFLRWHILKRQLGKQNFDDAWEPLHFLKNLYSVKKPKGIRERLFLLVRHLENLPGTQIDGSVIKLKRKTVNMFKSVVANEPNENKLKNFVKRLPFGATISKKKLEELYGGGSKQEFLQKIIKAITKYTGEV